MPQACELPRIEHVIGGGVASGEARGDGGGASSARASRVSIIARSIENVDRKPDGRACIIAKSSAVGPSPQPIAYWPLDYRE
jgi:hypothetical protein